MPRGEALRGAVRLEIESLLEQPRMTAKPGRCRLPAPLQRVQAQALERGKGDPLRHALGEPLLTASFAGGELDLRYVGEQAQPFTLGPVRRLVVEEYLAA